MNDIGTVCARRVCFSNGIARKKKYTRIVLEVNPIVIYKTLKVENSLE